MISLLSHTRLTLALDIVRKLKTGPFAGFHEMGIIKHQIDLHDEITVAPAREMAISCNHPLVPLDETNACWKAAALMKERFKIRDNVNISILKAIPVMGGLAGGSANAATVLEALNRLWGLELKTDQLISLGRQIGMDVPFYFLGSTAFDTECTGILEKVPTNLAYNFIIAVPSFGVSTAEAYAGLDYSAVNRRTGSTAVMKQALMSGDDSLVVKSIHNDFETSVFKRYPALKVLKQRMLDLGCLAAFLSGSGSSIIGIAENEKHGEKAGKQLDCTVIHAKSLQ